MMPVTNGLALAAGATPPCPRMIKAAIEAIRPPHFGLSLIEALTLRRDVIRSAGLPAP